MRENTTAKRNNAKKRKRNTMRNVIEKGSILFDKLMLFFHPFDIQLFCIIVIVVCGAIIACFPQSGTWPHDLSIGLSGSAGVAFIVEMVQNQRNHKKRTLCLGHLFFQLALYNKFKPKAERIICKYADEPDTWLKVYNNKRGIKLQAIAECLPIVMNDLTQIFEQFLDAFTYKENLICSVIIISYDTIKKYILEDLKKSHPEQTCDEIDVLDIIKKPKLLSDNQRESIEKELLTIDSYLHKLTKSIRHEPPFSIMLEETKRKK